MVATVPPVAWYRPGRTADARETYRRWPSAQDTIDDNTCSIRSSKSVEYCAHAELADEGLRVRFYATAVNEAIDSVLRNNVANKTTVAIESEGEPQPLGKGMRCARATMSELPERVVFTFAHDPDAVLSDPVNQILRYGIRVGNLQVVLCRLDVDP